MKLLKRAFWALDRYLGGDVRPTQARIRAVRHPLPFGAAGAVFSAGMCALTLGRVDWQVALFGVVVGVGFGLLVIFERRRLEHYGFHVEESTVDRPHRD